MVEGDVHHGANFVAFAEMCNDEFGVLDTLFRFKVEDFHAAEVRWAMADGSGCGAVDTHLGEEGREVGGLDFLALFSSEACRAYWIL